MAKDPDETGLGFGEPDTPSSGGGGKSKWIIIAVVGIAAIVAISLLVSRGTPLGAKLTLEDVNADVVSLMAAQNKTDTRLTNTRTQVALHTEDIADMKKDIGDLTAPTNYQPQINGILADIAALNESITSWNCTLNTTLNITDWQPQIDELAAQIAALNVTVNNWTAPVTTIPYCIVTGKTIDTIRVKIYGTEDASVVATIYGTNLPATASTSSGSILGCWGGNSTLFVAIVPPIDKWSDGGIIDINVAGGSISSATATIGV